MSAESRIRDVDVAFEAAELTRLNILQQASASVLAQANQQPALALTLLQ
jgi:flagellin